MVIAVVPAGVVEVASLVLASLVVEVVEVELDVVGATLVVALAVVASVVAAAVADIVEVDEFAVVSLVGLPAAQAEAIRRSPHAPWGRNRTSSGMPPSSYASVGSG
ncbi:hypothetical protein [Nannocystis exedens]|uniref:hypothetical protein n=1 Tax=Nannocystis exedens TaxID=54 RepID=UPI0011608505|nr:hypothetical protein [Nannocystis exedens]